MQKRCIRSPSTVPESGPRTDASHVNNNVLSLCSNLLIAICLFFVFFTVIRTYPKAVYAEWVYYMTILTLVEYLRSGLVRNALVKFLAGVEREDERKKIIGSGWAVSLGSTAAVSVLCYGAYAVTGAAGIRVDYLLVFTCYPLFALASSPVNMAEVLLQAENRFGVMLVLKTIEQTLFLLFCIGNYFLFRLPVWTVVAAQIAAVGLVSVAAVVLNLSGLGCLLHARLERIKKVLRFGLFSMGATLGQNLQKSAALVVIGIMLSKVEVALYSVPLKLIDVLQIPLISFSNVAFPFLSRAGNGRDPEKMKDLFYRYAGVLTILFAPLLAAVFFLAEPVIVLFSGEGYVRGGVTVTLLRLFVVAGFFLPLDRFIVNTLEGLGLPRYTFIKTAVAAAVNAAGIVIAVLAFHSLESAAAVTVITTLGGLVLGAWFLKRRLGVRYRNIFPFGLESLRENARWVRRAVFKAVGWRTPVKKP